MRRYIIAGNFLIPRIVNLTFRGRNADPHLMYKVAVLCDIV